MNPYDTSIPTYSPAKQMVIASIQAKTS